MTLPLLHPPENAGAAGCARILFVDDEQSVLAGIKNTLRRERTRWDLVFAQGPEAALAELGRGPFDLVVSDMRMPGLDGAALLEEVRRMHPHAVRVVLSGYADRDAVMRGMGVAHQFLSKPCDGAVLRTTIERTLALRDLLDSDAQRTLTTKLDSQPAPATLFRTLVGALADPEVDSSNARETIERHPRLSARLLQLADWPLLGPPPSVGSVDRAVLQLGLELVTTLGLMAHALSSLERFGVRPDRWIQERRDHALAVGLVARSLVPWPELGRNAFAAGLLHDVGELVQDALGPNGAAATHAEAGAMLLMSWGLPLPIVEAVAHHHQPRRLHSSEPNLASVIHVADALVCEVAPCHDGASLADLDAAIFDSLGLDRSLDDFRRLARQVADRDGSHHSDTPIHHSAGGESLGYEIQRRAS